MPIHHPRLFSTPVPTGFAALLFAASLAAQPAGRIQPGTWLNGANLSVVHQFDADLDAGGTIGLTRLSAGFNTTRVLEGNRMIGFGIDLAQDVYDFAGDAGLGASSPWGTVRELGASVSYATTVGDGWRLRIAPMLRSSAETSASVSDSYVFGGFVAATKQINEGLTLGFGAGVFSGLEETRAIPFLAINWKFAPKWSVGNPFRPGPTGPAGIEVAYKGETWEFGFGGAYRSVRFRLDEEGERPNGFGEYNGVPLFIRATRPINPYLSLDLYAGGIVGGSIELEDSEANDLIRSDYDFAPLVAITINGRF